MKSTRFWGVMLCVAVSSLFAAEREKPRDLPSNYRDVQIYTTSEPDAADPARIVMTVHLLNHGKRSLRPRLLLSPNAAAGFDGGEESLRLKAGKEATWTLELRPPEGLRYEVLEGEIWFGKTLARELFIAVQGPDPADFESKRVQKITDAAKVVGTHAPRVQVDWWRTHPSSSVQPQQRRKPLITLAARGETEYALVVEPMPGGEDGRSLTLDVWAEQKELRPGEDHLIAAVRDLQRCIEIMSGGGRLRITRHRPVKQSAIILSIVEDKRLPHNDSYRLRTTKGGDVLIEAGQLDGLRQGIYGLLTDHLDCHWFMPGEMGEEIPTPEDGAVVIGQIDERRSPSFFSAFGTSWGSHRDWDCRNRSYINRARMVFGHSWYSFINTTEYPFEEYPDMWARDREGKVRKRGNTTNFCSTSPEVIEIVARKVNERLRNPDVLITSLDPNDYAPMCLCDRCLALDRSYGVENPDGTFVSDRVLHFSREIYNRLEPENKGKYLGILVYAYQMELPKKAVPHEYHTGMVCNMFWTYDHTRPFTDPTAPTGYDFYRLLKGWGEILPQFGYYDYYGRGGHHFGPWGQVYKMREDLPAFRDVGGTYLMLECQPNFAMHGLNNYIAGRLSWDVDADVDVLLEEFFQKYYGPAAEPMRRFWLDIERYYALLRPGPGAAERVRHTPGMWEALWVHLDEARDIVAELPEDQKRFQDRVTFTRDGFDIPWRQFAVGTNYVPHGEDRPPMGPAEIIKAADEGLARFAEVKEKYISTGYWPTYLPVYYHARVAGTFEKAKAKAEEQLKQGEPTPAD